MENKKNYNNNEVQELNKFKVLTPKYLLQNEFVQSEYLGYINGLGGGLCGIFITNLRVLLLAIDSHTKAKLFGKPKVISEEIRVGSVYYNNIENIQFSGDLNLPFHDLTIILKGNSTGEIITVKKEDSSILYRELNQKLVSADIDNTDNAIEYIEIANCKSDNQCTNSSKKESKSSKKIEKKKISKEKRKEATKKVVSYFGEKTLQFGKWGANQVKNKSEQILHDIKDKK